MCDQVRNNKGQFTDTPRVQYESGDKYGFLMLTGKSYMQPYSGANRRFVEVICRCGKIFFTYFSPLRMGTVVSCGCNRDEKAKERCTKHGMAKTGDIHPIYNSWTAMRSRCYNEKDIGFNNYGGRGVRVCSEWKDDFIPFQKWALENGWEEGLTLDRKDNEFGNYEPSNCKWSTPPDQSRNKRTNHWITIFGETKCFKDWTKDERCKVGYGTFHYRLMIKKWSPQDSLTTPPMTKNRKT